MKKGIEIKKKEEKNLKKAIYWCKIILANIIDLNKKLLSQHLFQKIITGVTIYFLLIFFLIIRFMKPSNKEKTFMYLYKMFKNKFS